MANVTEMLAAVNQRIAFWRLNSKGFLYANAVKKLSAMGNGPSAKKMVLKPAEYSFSFEGSIPHHCLRPSQSRQI